MHSSGRIQSTRYCGRPPTVKMLGSAAVLSAPQLNIEFAGQTYILLLPSGGSQFAERRYGLVSWRFVYIYIGRYCFFWLLLVGMCCLPPMDRCVPVHAYPEKPRGVVRNTHFVVDVVHSVVRHTLACYSINSTNQQRYLARNVIDTPPYLAPSVAVA